MEITEVKKTILNELKKQKTITAQVLNYNPFNIPLIQTYGIMSKLVELGAVEKKEKTYLLIDERKGLEIFNQKTITKVKKNKISKPPLILTGRNTSKYVFEKIRRSKGQTVLSVIHAYVRDNKNVTTEKLLKVFPSKVKRYGTINSLDKAIVLSTDPKRPRYFFKNEDVISLKNQKIVATNQWTQSDFLEFIALAKKLGYVITLE